MNLDDILSSWETDCVIDEMNLDEVSRQTPQLHAKYLKMLVEAKLKLRSAEMKQKTLLKDKWLYYNNKMTQEEMDERGWSYDDPKGGLKVMKTEMNYFYDADTDIQNSELKVQYWKTVVSTLTEIIDNLKWRHNHIKNMIAWRQFQAGN